jgi:uncharacterized Zn finger protein (UPF0148 family)
MIQKVGCEDGRMRYLLKVGDLSERKERKEGRWRIARRLGAKMLYIGCPHCNGIIELRTGAVLPNGNLRGNIACPSCEEYSLCKLESWEEYLESCNEKGESP